MKILICSRYFWPQNLIGAIRPTNFAHYLAKFGHQVSVITELSGKEGVENEYTIYKVSNAEFLLNLKKRIESKNTLITQSVKEVSKIPPKKNNIFIDYRRHIVSLIIDFVWLIRARKYIKQQVNQPYDIVISSYSPLSSFLLGRYIKKAGLAKYWISDLRDTILTGFTPNYFKLISKYYEKNIMKNADVVTLVSKGQVEIFANSVGHSLDSSKIVVLYNGFSSFNDCEYVKKDSDKLIFTYTGTLYEGKRDISMLFHAIKQLIESRLVDIKKIELHYAGDESLYLYKQASDFNLSEIIVNHGIVNKIESKQLQNNSDLLIVLSWNTTSDKGILTGKFLEYLQAKKPIISLTTGSCPKAELSDMINSMRLGVACEYVCFEQDLLRLKDYILLQYNLKAKENRIFFDADLDQINRFHYENISRQLEGICFDLLN